MKVKKIGNKLIDKIRGTTVNQYIKICVECGSTKISISEKTVNCKDCGVSHKRKNIIPNLKFRPSDLVRIIDSGKNSELVYKIEKINQDSEGVIHYVLKSKSSKITLFYHENSESHLEKSL